MVNFSHFRDFFIVFLVVFVCFQHFFHFSFSNFFLLFQSVAFLFYFFETRYLERREGLFLTEGWLVFSFFITMFFSLNFDFLFFYNTFSVSENVAFPWLRLISLHFLSATRYHFYVILLAVMGLLDLYILSPFLPFFSNSASSSTQFYILCDRFCKHGL